MRRLFLGLLLAAAACGRTDRGPHTDDGTLSAGSTFLPLLDSAGQHRYQVTNVRFLAGRILLRGDSLRRPLVKETFVQRCCAEGEREITSTLSLEGRGRADHPVDLPVWRLTLPADEGEVWGSFYRATLHGCCDQTDALSYVHLETGVLAFVVSNADRPPAFALPALRVPNSPLLRYAGFLDRVTPVVPPEGAEDSTVVGVLQYGPGDAPGSRWVLRNERGRGLNYRLGRLGFLVPGRETQPDGSADLWSADGQTDPGALSGFSVTITLLSYDAPGLTIEVPVIGDRPDPGGTALPAGWSLRPRGE